MGRSQIWFALGAVNLALLFAYAFADGDVFVLTEANFEKEVGQDRAALVEFYAPWYSFFFFSLIMLILLYFFITLDDLLRFLQPPPGRIFQSDP